MAASAVEPEALVVSHGFDSGGEGEPYPATIRFSGRRASVQGKPQDRDTFVHEETIDRVIPGTGPVSVTAWVYGLEPGEWSVSSELIDAPRGVLGAGPPTRARSSGTRRSYPASWSWRRWALSSRPGGLVKTRWALLAPLARSPAVLPGSYPALVALAGFVVVAMQAALLGPEGVALGRALTVSLIAAVAGLIGAKTWYAVLHPGESLIRGGWAVDGFLIVTPVVAAVTLLAFDLPIGVYLDATTPGLFFGIAIGRLGCFLTGCCAGRCTASRWGVWSSDRRVGARRVPTQLMEAGVGTLIGAAALVLVLAVPVPIFGAIFVSAFAAYALARQILLRLRAEQRRSSRTVPLTGVAAVLVLLFVTVLSILQAT